ncbi:hypothetical protein D3C81_2015350 [compost metagenome]
MVDAATVDGPEITRQPVARIGAVEVVLQPDEIEGCADPGDAGDHVNPANAQVQPFGQMCFHSRLPLSRRSSRRSLGFSY